MRYTSTRSDRDIESAQAIAQGIADDGGLFVPKSFPHLTEADFEKLIPMSYKDRAAAILSLYLTDFTPEEIRSCVEGAYTGTFENDNPAPLVEAVKDVYFLELWHGPTCAFKDMALQLLPHLLTVSAAKTAPGRTKVILVATSGDTGKAALDGFADVPGTKIIVFFPRDGVSAMQELQMRTQTGANVAVCGIEGNFDDAQTGVKAIFADKEMREFLKSRNMDFSSANSINFGRLVPQIVYYVSAYCDLRKKGALGPDGKFNVAVPTGNFGNILAAVYAKRMGVPVARFLCASNKNNILTDFIRTGVYDRNRGFYTTSSPSMDILISSNLERMLYHLYDGDAASVRTLMESLAKTGRYEISPAVLAKLQAEFSCGWCGEEETASEIGSLFRDHHYLCDTHTAVAASVCGRFRAETGDSHPVVIASTASPFKFAHSVLPAVFSGAIPENEFETVETLSKVSGVPVPPPIAALRNMPVLHKASVNKKDMTNFIRSFLAGC